IPTLKILTYISRIQNQSLRDAMALFAFSKAGAREHHLYTNVSNFAAIIRLVMAEQSIESVGTINPNDLLFQMYEGKVGRGLTEGARFSIFTYWATVCGAFEDYAEKLSEPQRRTMSRFFIQRLTDRRKLAKRGPRGTMQRTREARVKAKTDAVHGQFHHLRYMSTVRFNQVERLRQAVEKTILQVKRQKLPLPFGFSYDELMPTQKGRSIRQRVYLVLWDAASLFDHCAAHGCSYGDSTRKDRAEITGRFSQKHQYEVEYVRTDSLEARISATPFWFAELFDHEVFTKLYDARRRQRRNEFHKRWGYSTKDFWVSRRGLLAWNRDSHREIVFLRETRGQRFLPVTGIYHACLFGNLLLRIQTVNGARIGEFQQIAQNPECIKQLVNVGPKAGIRWLFRVVPKGRRERANYFIDEDTKDHIVKVISFLREACGTKKLPEINFSPKEKAPPDRYVFQWQNRLLSQSELSYMLRFLLHGVVLNQEDGKGIHLTSHILRHALATEMASLKTSIDVIATILHQRDVTVTKYYSRPTTRQVMQSMESLLVDRIDIAAEALRSPDEIAQMLKDAEGKVGALTEVLGGTCTVGNLCSAKFACIGCAGNAADPTKRQQVEHKRTWATEQARWARKQQLHAEERQMKQLVQDCDLLLEEMRLIEQGRTDGRQLVQIHTSVPE
ncbi:MAG TPA: hypothetical protein VN857_03445, partial [Chthoniobacterales bacterium]|nr:hypothetical protein [Chthoniobacterales bacterium]